MANIFPLNAISQQALSTLLKRKLRAVHGSLLKRKMFYKEGCQTKKKIKKRVFKA
jgi:hypothetical protein